MFIFYTYFILLKSTLVLCTLYFVVSHILKILHMFMWTHDTI